VRAFTIAGLVGAAGYLGYQAAHPRAQRWGPGFHRGPGKTNAVYLTFDDGPSNETEHFLDLLAEHGAKATFFVCGRNIERRPQPARRALAEGHVLGNHTQNHRFLLGLGPAGVRDEVARAQHAIEDATGTSPRLFRPPYGVRSPWLPPALAEHDLVSVHWTVIGNDWALPAPGVLARVRPAMDDPGAIICLHDGDGVRAEADRRATLEATADLLRGREGTDFRTLEASGE